MGVDIGTSGSRAVLYDSSGYEVASGREEYSLICPRPGWMELDPSQVFAAVISAVSKCVAASGVHSHQIAGMGLSCQMHSLLAVGRDGCPLTPIITWADTRSNEEAEFIGRGFPVRDLYRRTGCRVQHPFYPISKILWFRKNHPDLVNRTVRWMTIKDYILYRWFGLEVTDYTLASAQGFFNIHKQDWDDDILKEVLGIDRSVLCAVVPCTYALKGMKRQYAEAMGVSENIPVAVGSGDGATASLGCGAVSLGAISSTIGTSGALRTTVPKPVTPEGQTLWCYSFTDDLWLAGGAVSNGGVVLRWFRDNFRDQFEKEAAKFGGDIYRLFDSYAEEVPPGCNGLLFLPNLAGERNPDWNARATGMMLGLTYAHTKKDLIRAAMEGVLFRLYSVYLVLREYVGREHEIRASGGYTRSKTWLSMQADLFGKRIVVPQVTEASALGAAYLAMLATGAADGLHKPLPSMQAQSVVEPDEEKHGEYQDIYEKAMIFYETIKMMEQEKGVGCSAEK